MSENKLKASELRIGNWFKWNGGFETVSSIVIDQLLRANGVEHYYVNNYNLKDLEPIPLTPEILGNAGFIMLGTYYDKKIGLNTLSIELPDGETNLDNDDAEMFCIEVQTFYVHQLQNLYFALTGEELEINL